MKELWTAGEIITLGRYQQSRADSFEPVEWKILQVYGEKAFVTSVYALDAQPFNAMEEQPANSEAATLGELIPAGFNTTTWENSTLRAWLNSYFREKAFSAQEQACLLAVDELADKISLLALDANINDATLFPSDASTGCRATPYAAGLYDDDIEKDRQESATRPLPTRASYWLRSKGTVIHGDNMAGVQGVVCLRFNLTKPLAVRPVLMVDLNQFEALLEKQGQIVHRFAITEWQGSVQIDTASSKIIADGVGYPDLHLEYQIHGNMDNDTTRAILTCLVMAILGDPKAQNSIGTLFWNGEHFVQNFAEAAKWNTYAANQGLPEAMVDMADAYFNAKGVERDYQKAFALSLGAAEKGLPLGMLNAGKCYANGWGTERSLEEARKWYKKAADTGNSEAAVLLKEADNKHE